MNIEWLKQLSFYELQNAYEVYLSKQDLQRSTIATSKNDAFYLVRHNNSVDFWALLLSADFEQEAKRLLFETLSKRSKGNVESNLNSYMAHLRRFRKFALADGFDFFVEKRSKPEKKKAVRKSYRKKWNVTIPIPSCKEVEKYLKEWDSLENYRLQEDALNKLFFDYAPENTNIEDILLKVSTLNDFYSTNIFSTYPVAKHILSLGIDGRLQAGDAALVDDIKDININGKTRNFYSFATKYCSHHNPKDYAIYDSYVDEVLRYFRDVESFAEFRNEELKQYQRFKEILIEFQNFYGLNNYTLKQIDQYLWQIGKTYFPKYAK